MDLLHPSVLIVEDDRTFRARFEKIVSRTANLRIVAAVESVAEALREIAAHDVDLLIVDLGLPDGDGTAVIRKAVETHPDCAVMVVTVFGDEENVVTAIEAGASGYLLKDSTSEDFALAIDDLLQGGSPVSPMVARLILNRVRGSCTPVSESGEADESAARLSEREAQILTLVAKGFGFGEICRLLSISTNTVKTHVNRIYRKLAVHSRGQAVYEATRLGLIEI